MQVFSLFLLTLATLVTKASAISQAQFDQLKTDVRRLGRDADTIGGIVRLVGHDLMDYRPNEAIKGGTDGCLDWADPDNAGLQDVWNDTGLAGLFEVWSPFVSKADFMVAAGNAMLEQALDNNPTTDLRQTVIPFRHGRVAVEDCSFTQHRMPSAENALGEVQKIFTDANALGLTMRETSAMMGVHTLGRAQTSVSGYNGFWDNARTANRLDNAFFTSMLNVGWDRSQNSPGKHQWVRGRNAQTLMLNTDMVLAFDIGTDADVNSHSCHTRPRQGGRCGLDSPDCCRSSNYANMREFADNEDTWLREFIAVWVKAVEKGHPHLCQVGQCFDAGTNSCGTCAATATANAAGEAADTAAAAAADAAAALAEAEAELEAADQAAGGNNNNDGGFGGRGRGEPRGDNTNNNAAAAISASPRDALIAAGAGVSLVLLGSGIFLGVRRYRKRNSAAADRSDWNGGMGARRKSLTANPHLIGTPPLDTGASPPVVVVTGQQAPAAVGFSSV